MQCLVKSMVDLEVAKSEVNKWMASMEGAKLVQTDIDATLWSFLSSVAAGQHLKLD